MVIHESRRVEPSTADEAIDALYRESATRALRLAYLMSGDLAVAEEIVQEAFVRTWRAWDRIRDTDAAYGYLRTTIVNLSKSTLRRRALEVRHRTETREMTHEVDVAARADVITGLRRLPPRMRACVALRYYEDLSEAETARALGISVGAVKSQTSKALRRLEQLLEGERDG